MTGVKVGGEITNKFRNKNWKKKVNNLKIDPTLNWELAEILNIDESELVFRTIKGIDGKLIKKNIVWAVPNKKTLNDRFDIGDIIFVKKKE